MLVFKTCTTTSVCVLEKRFHFVFLSVSEVVLTCGVLGCVIMKQRFHHLAFGVMCCRITALCCCHSMSGESVHLKEDVHHLHNTSSICTRNGKGVFFFANARVL